MPEPRDPRALAKDPAGVREAWTIIEGAWAQTIEHAYALPEALLHQRVDDEWSFVETLRHLVFVSDAWIRRTILAEPRAYDRFALPPDDEVDVRPWGIDVSSRPSFSEILGVRGARTAALREIVDELTPAGLARICAPNPGPGFPPVTTLPVSLCLDVVIGEEWAHHGYAVRDLARVEARS